MSTTVQIRKRVLSQSETVLDSWLLEYICIQRFGLSCLPPLPQVLESMHFSAYSLLDNYNIAGALVEPRYLLLASPSRLSLPTKRDLHVK